jgi:hypothetical protein
MATQAELYAAIAATMRGQQTPEIPLKHEWLELLTRLSHDGRPQLRATAINELRDCADRATRYHHD